jgi:hypothetical protein
VCVGGGGGDRKKPKTNRRTRKKKGETGGTGGGVTFRSRGRETNSLRTIRGCCSSRRRGQTSKARKDRKEIKGRGGAQERDKGKERNKV